MYVPSSPVVAWAPRTFSSLSRMPFPFASTKAKICQPGRPGSPASFTPLAFRSWNFMPVFVACWKLPKSLPESSWPDVSVIAQPPWPVPQTLFAGKDCVQPACCVSQTR